MKEYFSLLSGIRDYLKDKSLKEKSICAMGLGFYITDKLIEQPLKLIPNYKRNKDKTLEECLYKIFKNEKLSNADYLKLGFQAVSVKTALVGIPAILADYSYSIGGISDSDPLFSFVTCLPPVFGFLFSIAHDSVMGKNLEKHINSLSEEEKKEVKDYLKDGKIDKIRYRIGIA